MSTPYSTSILHSGPNVSAVDIRCFATDAARSREEHASDDELVFPTAGVFVKHLYREDVVADASQVVFFRRGEAYRVSHPACCGDRCIVFRFAPEVLRDAVCAYDPKSAEKSGDLLRFTHCPADRIAYMMQAKFRAMVAANAGGQLGADELGMRILDHVLCAAYATVDVAEGRVSPQTVRVHREMVVAARALLARSFRNGLQLHDVARAVHSSPFHLARIFRREVGTSLHKHVIALRLRASLEHLAEQDADLTALALDLGFSSHSHFTNAFRREFRITPREFRRSVTGGRLREMSKILTV